MIKTYDELIEDFLLQIVSVPNDLEVDEVPQKDASSKMPILFIRIRCNKKDRGKVIGKKGATINALTTLLVAITGGNYKVKVELSENGVR
jgi:predicted RNA-binding protein YlqC (UPF0109 family)